MSLLMAFLLTFSLIHLLESLNNKRVVSLKETGQK